MMETKVNEEVNTLKWLLLKTHEDALLKNEEQTARWKLYRDDHESLSSRLMSFRDELTHPIMVPIGTKALMKGTLIHTNEILVCLGDNWFAKQSAKEAAELCQRRIKGSEEMLDKLNKERQLLETRKSFPMENDTFGHKEAQEIVEPYNEEAEKEWRERHRQKERDYHQKLAELKKQMKTQIETEDDLWKRLDALDLQEELEDDLDRLDEQYEEELESSETDNNEIQNTIEVKKQENNASFDNESDVSDDDSEEYTSDEEMQHSVQVMKQPNRVSFDNESDLSDVDNEPVHIVFQHSTNTKELSTCQDISPASIYTKFSECFIRIPKSILKKTTTHSLEEKTDKIDYLEEKTVQDLIEDEDKTSQEECKDISELLAPVFGDVVERTQPSTQVSTNTRPVSKFKASRQRLHKMLN